MEYHAGFQAFTGDSGFDSRVRTHRGFAYLGWSEQVQGSRAASVQAFFDCRPYPQLWRIKRMMELRDRMIEYRGRHGISQDELARICRVSRQTVAYIEKGRKPTPLTEAKISVIIKKEENI